MAPRPPVLGPGECDTETAARLIMVTPSWLRKLASDGWIKKLGPDRWLVIDVVQGHIRYLQDVNKKTTNAAQISRVQLARAEQIEIETKRTMRELLAVEDVEAFLSDTLGTLRTELVGLPAACSRDPEVRAEIEKQLDARIAKCRDAFGRAGAAIASRQPIVLEPEEADA
jgi:hypothetical protein